MGAGWFVYLLLQGLITNKLVFKEHIWAILHGVQWHGPVMVLTPGVNLTSLLICISYLSCAYKYAMTYKHISNGFEPGMSCASLK